MKDAKLEVVRGSGNIFRDFRQENADGEQLKALLAAEIIKKMARDELTNREASKLTSIDAGDFSRIRAVDLTRFTIDRLMIILNRLGSRVEVSVRFRKRPAREPHVAVQ